MDERVHRSLMLARPKFFRLRADPLVSFTFRFPASLKRDVEEMAEKRSMTVTRLVVEALEFCCMSEPPLWAVNLMAGYKPQRQPVLSPSPTKREKAKAFVTANPRGVHAHEVARVTGQTTASAFNTLASLVNDGEIACHGARYRKLWTPLGAANPIPRVKSVKDAIVRVLTDAADEPVNHMILRDAVTKLVFQSTGKKLGPGTAVAVIYRAVRQGVIRKVGANERGVLYALVKQPKGDPDAALN